MLSHYRLSVVNKAGSKAHGMTLVLVDGGKYKDQIAARMRKPNGTGPGRFTRTATWNTPNR